jgi:hypothetical protein
MTNDDDTITEEGEALGGSTRFDRESPLLCKRDKSTKLSTQLIYRPFIIELNKRDKIQSSPLLEC